MKKRIIYLNSTCISIHRVVWLFRFTILSVIRKNGFQHSIDMSIILYQKSKQPASVVVEPHRQHFVQSIFNFIWKGKGHVTQFSMGRTRSMRYISISVRTVLLDSVAAFDSMSGSSLSISWFPDSGLSASLAASVSSSSSFVSRGGSSLASDWSSAAAVVGPPK